MANIQPRYGKDGKLISYSIRVFRGRDADGKQLKPATKTFTVEPGWTETSALKKATAAAAVFEQEIKQGLATDTRRRFDEYCNYVLELKEQRGLKHSTAVRYRELMRRIFPAIGHIKLKDLRADHLNDFYTKLGKSGVKKSGGRAVAKVDLAAALKEGGVKQVKIVERSGCSKSAISAAVKGDSVSIKTAQAIADALGVKLDEAFTVTEDGQKLSTKTIIEHHRLISTVLDQALKDGLVSVNVAERATLPKLKHKEVDFYEPETLISILDALEDEPIKWRVLVHLFVMSGARRGEILGLRWSGVDFENCQIHVEQNVLYSVERGVYLDTLKTDNADRFISLPAETMALLRQYRAWQAEERLRLGEYYKDNGFLFAKDNGEPLHPDSVSGWLDKFSKRHGLPHLHAHAFRHSAASLLIFHNLDDVSLSRRLGHANADFAKKQYGHLLKKRASEKSAAIMGDALLKKA